MYENELYHYGIPNMRWGQRRFQNPDGSLTPAGRERYGSGNSNTKSNTKTLTLKIASKSEREAKKAAAEREKKKQEAAKAKQAEADRAKLKSDIMSKGDYKKALENVDMFSNNELQTLIERKAKMDSLKKMKVEDIKNDKKKFLTTVNKVNDYLLAFANTTSNGIRLYNNIAGIRNTYAGEDKEKWKTIKTGSGG